MSPSVNTFKSRLDKYWTGRGREDREGERRKRRGPLRVVSHPTFEIPKKPWFVAQASGDRYEILLFTAYSFDLRHHSTSK